MSMASVYYYHCFAGLQAVGQQEHHCFAGLQAVGQLEHQHFSIQQGPPAHVIGNCSKEVHGCPLTCGSTMTTHKVEKHFERDVNRKKHLDEVTRQLIAARVSSVRRRSNNGIMISSMTAPTSPPRATSSQHKHSSYPLLSCPFRQSKHLFAWIPSCWNGNSRILPRSQMPIKKWPVPITKVSGQLSNYLLDKAPMTMWIFLWE